jgi:uncharacterized protein YbjT (DUF2867 family)/membrane protease YdiL (CAAX protease family)
MPQTSPVLVTGASGFVGSHLAQALVEAGYPVRAMTRRPETYRGAGDPVHGDVTDEAGLDRAMDGVRVAYYLVHSLESADFEGKDAEAARAFARAASRAGLERIIYLGGLGTDGAGLSAHLRSRREVEHLLAEGSVPVTVLRAAVVVGHGGISWEITRQLVDHLPAMVTPRWVNTRTQPIALSDVLRYLVGVLEPEEAKGKVYEIGGPDVLRYLDMLKVAAAVQGKSIPSVSVPLLTPHLSSLWLSLVTDVDTATGRTLIDSMSNEVVVTDTSILDVVPGPTVGYRDAVKVALADRAAAAGSTSPPATTSSTLRAEPVRSRMMSGLTQGIRTALIDRVPRDHHQPDSEFRRRRLVAGLFLAVGAVLLGLSLAVRPGDDAFYWLGLAVAATWATGGMLSGPLHLGYLPLRGSPRRPVLTGLAVGAAAGVVFLVGGLVVREIPPLHTYVTDVLAHAQQGSPWLIPLVTVVNGLTEEVFFRGALYAAIGRRYPVVLSTVVYAAATLATRNPMLVFAALTLGIVLGLQRRASGGILAPAITHVTWSLMMLYLLPPLFA